MKPVLAQWPEKKRNLAFLPFALGVFLVAFVVLALATQSFFLTILLSPPLGVAGAYALVGFPRLARKDGRPLVDEKTKPYLFFVLAPLLMLVLYPVLGVALTNVGLPPKWLAIVSMTLAIGLGLSASYLLVGFPPLWRQARESYARLPPERRPFLFFPLFVVFFLVLYLTLGVLTTRVLPALGPTERLLNLQVLLLLPLTLALAALLAYLLVGFPRPRASLRESLPKVTGKHRPRYFLLTLLLAGIPLTMVIGAVLTTLSSRFLPPAAVLPLALGLGYALSLGVAALAWGTPQRWRRYDDYTPGIPQRARLPLFGGISLVSALVLTVLLGVAGLDIFWSLLLGLAVGVALLLALTGLAKRIAARRHERSLLPELPDGLKPLVLFPTWFLVAGLLFAVLTYAFPRIVAVNAVIGIVAGLALAFFLVEQPLWKDLREERRREREKRKQWEARRKQALAAGAAEEPQDGAPQA